MLSLMINTSCSGGLDAYSKLRWDPCAASFKPVDSFVIQAPNYEPNVHLTSYILILLMNQNLWRVTDCRAAAVWPLRAKVSAHFIYHTNDQFWSLNTGCLSGAAWRTQLNVLTWCPCDKKIDVGCPLHFGLPVLLHVYVLAHCILTEGWSCSGCGSSI